MTALPNIADVDRLVTYAPSDSAGPFPVPFPIFEGDGSDLLVTLNGDTLTLWTFTGTSDPSFYGSPNTYTGGSITLAAPVTGTLIIQGRRAPYRTQQYEEGRGVPARDLNYSLNLLTAREREIFEHVGALETELDELEDLVSRIGTPDEEALLRIGVGDVNGLSALLAGKSPVGHTHPISDVIALQGQLDALAVMAPRYRFALLSTLTAIVLTNTAADFGKGGDVVADTVGTTASRARASNVATIVTAAAHGLSTGKVVNIRNLGGTGYNETGVSVTVVNSTTFTYPNTGGNESTTADTGGTIDRNGEYTWSGTAWVYVADQGFSQLNSRLLTIETETYDLRNDGPLGGVAVKTTSANGDVQWDPKDELTNNSVRTINWAAGSFQGKVSPAATPGNYSFTPSGNNLIISRTAGNSLGLFAASTGLQVRKKAVYTFGGRITAGDTDGVSSTKGFALVFTSVAPVNGGATATFDNASEAIVWRQNVGGLVVYSKDGSVTASPPSIALGVPLNATNYLTNDDVQYVVTFDDLGTSADILLTVAGVLRNTYRVSGLTVGDHIYFGMRDFSTIAAIPTVSMTVYPVQEVSPGFDNTKRIFLDPSIGSTGNGTPGAPYQGADAIAGMIENSGRTKVKFLLKDGIIRNLPWSFLSKRWDEVTIAGVHGANPRLYMSNQITSGWTQPDAATYPNVWMHDNLFNGLVGYTGSEGGLTEVTAGATQACGNAGLYTLPYYLYFRLSPNTSLATINLTANRTSVSAHTTGPYAGKLLVHCRGSLNPNTLTFEMCSTAYGIRVSAGVGTDWNTMRLNLEGIEVRYAYYNIWAERCGVNFERVTSKACPVGNAFQLNQVDGSLFGCIAEGSYSDGYNGQAQIADASVPARSAMVTFDTCEASGFPLSPDGSWFGDCWSNHATQEWHLKNCIGRSPAKDGLSAIDAFTARDCYISDAGGAGLVLAAPGVGKTATIIGGRLYKNKKGVAGGGGGAGNSQTLEVRGTIIDSSTDYSVEATTLSDGSFSTVNCYDVKTLGPTPSGGHKHTSGTNTTINVYTSTPLT
jgi:hypothetical protein